jgi:hypothetical protein
MKGLILLAILGMALPAFADPIPAVTSKATDEVAPTSEPARAEAAQAVEPRRPEPVRPPVSADAVRRATFATGIDHREPVDSITSLENDQGRVYYFTEFVGLAGRKLTHRWEYKGEVKAEVPITIGGPHWRAYSSKALWAGELGEWKVSVVDESGNVIRTDSLTYEAAAPEPAVAGPTEMPTSTPAAAMASTAPAASEAPAEKGTRDDMPASPAPAQP